MSIVIIIIIVIIVIIVAGGEELSRGTPRGSDAVVSGWAQVLEGEEDVGFEGTAEHIHEIAHQRAEVKRGPVQTFLGGSQPKKHIQVQRQRSDEFLVWLIGKTM